MKRALALFSVVAIAGSLWIAGSVLKRPTLAHAKHPVEPFSGFPVDQPRTVELSGGDEAAQQLSAREYSDQVKDWLLMTVMSDAGLSPAELNQSLFDLPPIRYGYVRPVGSFDYGETRARAIGAGRFVALLPKADAAARLDALAEIADDARKNTGVIPKSILLFEYEMASDGSSAEVTRRADFDASSLFAASNGYFETAVANLSELRGFMGQIDDLTYARVENGSLRLGGRKHASHHHHNITIDDAAALWSAQMKLREKNDQFDRFVSQKEEELHSRWEGRTYVGEAEHMRLEAEHDADVARVRAEVEAERDRLGGVVRSTGFSLDPNFEYGKVKAELQGFLGIELLLISKGQVSGVELKQVAEEAGQGKMDAFYAMLGKLEPEVARAFVSALKRRCSYQAARYDGALQGTEVGMVLFYTDLLAKLWALDYMNSAPDNYISDFQSMSHATVSVIYEKEMSSLPSTRLWFGVQNRGFAVKDTDSPNLLLAPVATRLYAASSDSLTPGKEVAPNPASAAFLGWWDDHYAEVARYEPEYERLNEIMKWSILISWLDEKGKLDLLAGLKDVRFKTDNWFPEWVKRHPDLRFQSWERIQFKPRGYAHTEALPLLESDDHVANPLMGGVSLAEKEVFATREAISEEIPEWGRRPNLKWSQSGADVFKTIDDSEFKFAQVGDRYVLDATLKAGTKFRALESEVADLHYSRDIAFQNSGLRMEVKNAGTVIGDLNIERGTNNFRVAWQSREMDAATSLARKVSMASDPTSVMARDSRVLTYLTTNDGNFLVRLKGSPSWLKLGVERSTGENGAIAEGWQSRVAPIDPKAKSINLAWFDDEKVNGEIGGDRFIRVPRGPGDQGMHLASSLPAGAEKIDFKLAGAVFQAQHDAASGDTFFRWADLPPPVREHPEYLLQPPPTGPPIEPTLSELASGDYDGAAKRLAQDPVAWKLALDEHYSSGLKKVDSLLAEGKDQQALELLDQLRIVHGDTPDIAIRKAVTLARGGVGPETATREVENAVNSGRGYRNEFFNEINARIKNHDGGPVLTVSDRGKIQLDFHTDHPFKGSQVSDLPAGSTNVYIQDSPALSNLDSPAAVQQAMHGAVQGELPIIIKTTQQDLAFFRPAKIYVGERKTTLHRVTAKTAEQVTTKPVRNYSGNSNNDACSPGSNDPNCPQPQEPVYLVVDPSKAAVLN